MAFYLVTGGAGFIGSHLVEALLASGHTVRVLDDLSSGRRENVPRQCELQVGDVVDVSAVERALAGVDECFHLAAITSVQRSVEDWRGTQLVNLTGTVTVFEAAARARSGRPVPVVYTSSAAVYGDNPDAPLAETATPAPLTAYAADKLGCELHAAVASRLHRVPTTGFRLFNVYGPRQDPASPYSGVISIFIDRILGGRPIEIHGDGEQVRDFVFVRDAVRFLITGMETAGTRARLYNVCTGRPTSITQLAEMLFDVCGRRVSVRHTPPRPGDVRHSLGAPDKAAAELGLMAETTLRQGLADTVRALGGAPSP